MNPYNVLSLNNDASIEEVKKAYRKLSLQHHPDKGGDSNEFHKIQSAYKDIISGDYKKRTEVFNASFESSSLREEVYEEVLGDDANQRHRSNSDKLKNFMKNRGGF